MIDEYLNKKCNINVKDRFKRKLFLLSKKEDKIVKN